MENQLEAKAIRSRLICSIPSAVTIGKTAAQSEAEQKDWQKALRSRANVYCGLWAPAPPLDRL
jgi:hypothetical protein